MSLRACSDSPSAAQPSRVEPIGELQRGCWEPLQHNLTASRVISSLAKRRRGLTWWLPIDLHSSVIALVPWVHLYLLIFSLFFLQEMEEGKLLYILVASPKTVSVPSLGGCLSEPHRQTRRDYYVKILPLGSLKTETDFSLGIVLKHPYIIIFILQLLIHLSLFLLCQIRELSDNIDAYIYQLFSSSNILSINCLGKLWWMFSTLYKDQSNCIK